MCSLCDYTGYRTVDIGTATIPDYEERRCRCNPDPTDEDAAWYEHADWFPDDDLRQFA